MLGPVIWASQRRELASTKFQAAHKSRMISLRWMLFDLHIRNIAADSPTSLLPKRISPNKTKGEGKAVNHRYARVMRIFPIIAERDDTPALIIMSRKNVLTVLALTSIRFAISLLLRPCSKYASASPSRFVK
jgi:hypothetical protein